jgi:hypothetical protein
MAAMALCMLPQYHDEYLWEMEEVAADFEKMVAQI